MGRGPGHAQGRITLWMVEVFVAVAETGSVSAAARRLGASVSAVSQQLSNLESALGLALADRTARPITLTASGSTFLRRARNILEEAALARSDLGAVGLAHLSHVRLGMIEDFDADVTPRLLTEMAGEVAECRFLLETGASHRLLSSLSARDLDLAVVADPGGITPEMEVIPLLEDPFVAVLPAPWRVRHRAPDLATLAALPAVLYTQRHVMGRQIASHMARQDVSFAPRFELDSYHAILAMVADGHGWTILSPLALRRAQRFLDRVAVVPMPGAPLSRRIVIAARRGATGTLPEETALRLRAILTDVVIGPARAQLPWLGDTIGLLADPETQASTR